ncbi:MAG: sulfotransferase [Aquificae bacterium]|nr:sulfotransferase [Aquificota bacterium]
MKKPNFFVVGAAKAGTTSIYNYLKPHPQVYVSPIKEPNFFSTDINPEKFRKNYKKEIEKDYDKYFKYGEESHLTFIRDLNDYLKLFEKVSTEKAIGEFSTSYLYSKVAAQNIKDFNPDAKIIIVLRNPIERAFSHYLMDLKIGYTNLSFWEAIQRDINSKEKEWGITHLYLELGLYYKQVKRYLNTFDKSQVKIFLFEELKNTEEFVKALYRFLEIDGNLHFPDTSKVYNKSKVPKYKNLYFWASNLGIIRFSQKIFPTGLKKSIKNILFSSENLPKLSVKEKEFLKEYYKKDIENLSNLIDKDLNFWLKV